MRCIAVSMSISSCPRVALSFPPPASAAGAVLGRALPRSDDVCFPAAATVCAACRRLQRCLSCHAAHRSSSSRCAVSADIGLTDICIGMPAVPWHGHLLRLSVCCTYLCLKIWRRSFQFNVVAACLYESSRHARTCRRKSSRQVRTGPGRQKVSETLQQARLRCAAAKDFQRCIHAQTPQRAHRRSHFRSVHSLV